jgi:hypothetical protein
MNKTFAGIGSRQTPPEILEKMKAIAKFLSERGYTLRSGGADGADSAFEQGATKKEIFLPWNNYNGRKVDNISFIADTLYDKHFNLAESLHPAWEKCSPGAKKMHARNTQQILGRNLDNPCDFVVCWTKDGKLMGGTSTSIRLAMSYNIPVFNLGAPEGLQDFRTFCKKLMEEQHGNKD